MVRKTGFMLGYTSPEGSLTNDRAGLLPTSTKTSTTSEEDKSDSGSEKLNNSLGMSARNLPPVYVDIQEEIEQNLTQINIKGMKYSSSVKSLRSYSSSD